MIPIMDGIKEYLGMMHELPDQQSKSLCVCASGVPFWKLNVNGTHIIQNS